MPHILHAFLGCRLHLHLTPALRHKWDCWDLLKNVFFPSHSWQKNLGDFVLFSMMWIFCHAFLPLPVHMYICHVYRWFISKIYMPGPEFWRRHLKLHWSTRHLILNTFLISLSVKCVLKCCGRSQRHAESALTLQRVKKDKSPPAKPGFLARHLPAGCESDAMGQNWASSCSNCRRRSVRENQKNSKKVSYRGDLLFIVFFSLNTIQIHNRIKNKTKRNKKPNVTNSYFSGNYISLAGFGQVTKVTFEKQLQVMIFPWALSCFMNYRFVLELTLCTSEISPPMSQHGSRKNVDKPMKFWS